MKKIILLISLLMIFGCHTVKHTQQSSKDSIAISNIDTSHIRVKDTIHTVYWNTIFKDSTITKYAYDTVRGISYIIDKKEYSNGNTIYKDSTVFHWKDSTKYNIKDSTVIKYVTKNEDKDTKAFVPNFKTGLIISLIILILTGVFIILKKLKVW